MADKEYEFDKEILPLLKDKATEEKFRELYTKAYGIDFVKTRLSDTKSELGRYKKEYESLQPVKQVYSDAQAFIKNKDFESLFELLKISDEDIFRHVHNKLELRERSPLEQQEYLRQRELQKRAYDLEKQNQFLSENYYGEVVQARHLQLDSELSKPEIKDFVAQFDARVGQPGAFKNEIINRGVFHYQRTGQDLPVHEVLQEVLKFTGYSPQASAAPMQQTTMPQAAPAAAASAPPVVKPTIPNVQGKGSSPVKSAPKSLDELRKLAKNL